MNFQKKGRTNFSHNLSILKTGKEQKLFDFRHFGRPFASLECQPGDTVSVEFPSYILPGLLQ